jgi:glycosyltransferase involved in cell wall biosynthesis
MRVLVITKDFPAPGLPEDGIVVLRQARALADLGHEMATARVVPHAPPLTPKWRGYRSIPHSYEVEGIPVTTLRALFPPRMIAMEYLPVQVGSALQKLTHSLKPDLVHAHCVIPSGQLAAGLSVPSIVTAHGSDAYDWPWRRPGLTRAARFGLKRATAVVAVSEYIRKRVCELVDRDVDVVYNGAGETIFYPCDSEDARRELGIEDSRFVVAFAGGPPKIKGVFDLIAVIADLTDIRPLLLVAGPNSDGEAIDAAARDAGADVRFCGMLDHRRLARVFAAANVFCLPSYREGLPLVVCEAMLSGRPVIATHAGGIPEIVRDGQTGLLFAPGDRSALASCLRQLASDSGLANRLGRAGYEFAREHLTWSANAARYQVLYNRVVSRNRSRATAYA